MADDGDHREERGEVVPLPHRRAPRGRRPERGAELRYMPPRGKRVSIAESLPPKRPFGGTPEQWEEAWRPAIMAASLSASALMLAGTFAIWA